jgi:L-lysine 6-transaminase
MDRSAGSYLVDARTGERYLDMFTFFASSALGMNHLALADDEAFRAELAHAAVELTQGSVRTSNRIGQPIPTTSDSNMVPIKYGLLVIMLHDSVIECGQYRWPPRRNVSVVHGEDPLRGSRAQLTGRSSPLSVQPSFGRRRVFVAESG